MFQGFGFSYKSSVKDSRVVWGLASEQKVPGFESKIWVGPFFCVCVGIPTSSHDMHLIRLIGYTLLSYTSWGRLPLDAELEKQKKMDGFSVMKISLSKCLNHNYFYIFTYSNFNY